MIDRETAYRKEQAVMTEKYNTILEVINDEIDKIVDAETANACVDKVLGMPHIWNSKLIASTSINEKCKTLGLTFDKLSKKYVAA